ncbi:T9SS type A sorting domain-containing protein [candidate division KSB1 bacterium]|nr:T9SS type A sorting domain-containing protein [candidate division KSB1 bacterium]
MLFLLMALVAMLAANPVMGVAHQTVAAPASVFFVANEGQWEEPFAFKLSTGGTTYFVTEQGLTIDIRQHDRQGHVSLSGLPPYPMGGLRGEEEPQPASVRGHVLKMNFVNRLSPHSVAGLRGVDRLPSYSNYFLGRDSCRWRSRVGHYQRVIAENVWPGIDVEFVADAPGIKTNYHVHPGADASQIQIEYEGLDAPLRVDGSGNLVLATSLGDLKEQAPWAYQIDGRHQRDVGVQFAVLDANRYGVLASALDASKELVIDPLIAYSSALGQGEGIESISRTPTGDIAVTGTTDFPGFPITPGAYQEQIVWLHDIFVGVLNTTDQALIFSTFVGGSAYDGGRHVIGLSDGRIFASGSTQSSDWPLAGDPFDNSFQGSYEAYVLILSADGTALDYSSFLGGVSDESVYAAVQRPGSDVIYLCGPVGSSYANFPLTPDAMFTASVGIGSFISVFDPNAQQLIYSTLFPCNVLGSSVYTIDILPIDESHVWICGNAGGVSGSLPITPDALRVMPEGDWDGFFAELDFSERRVDYCSYLGGEAADNCVHIVVQDQGVILAGTTRSDSFPLTPGAVDTTPCFFWETFVTRVTLPATISASTRLGGERGAYSIGIALRADGSVLVAGSTNSRDFLLTGDALDSTFNDGVNQTSQDNFFSILSPALDSLIYSTYLGGRFTDGVSGVLFSEGADSVWMCGYTWSADYPITDDAYQTFQAGQDQFVTLLTLAPSWRVAERPAVPATAFALHAYPNPFNSTLTITLDLSQTSPVTVGFFDALGRQININHLGPLSAGFHTLRVDMNSYPSGYYIVCARTPTSDRTVPVVLIR